MQNKGERDVVETLRERVLKYAEVMGYAFRGLEPPASLPLLLLLFFMMRLLLLRIPLLLSIAFP